jgi:hypothetical protein
MRERERERRDTDSDRRERRGRHRGTETDRREERGAVERRTTTETQFLSSQVAASDPDAARCRVATQFLESELDYWLSLQNAFKFYYKPLLQMVPDVLELEDLNAMFFNLEKLFVIHGRFFPLLKKRIMDVSRKRRRV